MTNPTHNWLVAGVTDDFDMLMIMPCDVHAAMNSALVACAAADSECQVGNNAAMSANSQSSMCLVVRNGKAMVLVGCGVTANMLCLKMLHNSDGCWSHM